MRLLPSFSSINARLRLIAPLSLAAIVLAAPLPVAAQNGSENPMFQRHFWRGQSYHGNFNVQARKTAPETGPATAEAMVEEGTPGAATAARARSCANRFKTYDPATATYIGRDGHARTCR